jgi:hypothetical protein
MECVSNSAAIVAARAVEQRRGDINRQPRPSDSEFEWVRGSGRSGESTHQYPSGVALDPAIAPRGRKIMQVALF